METHTDDGFLQGAQLDQVLARRDERDAEWQWRNREAMQRRDGLFLPAGSLGDEMNDYVDRFGHLAADFHELQYGAQPRDPDLVDNLRATLHRHLLIVGLLLEKVEALAST